MKKVDYPTITAFIIAIIYALHTFLNKCTLSSNHMDTLGQLFGFVFMIPLIISGLIYVLCILIKVKFNFLIVFSWSMLLNMFLVNVGDYIPMLRAIGRKYL